MFAAGNITCSVTVGNTGTVRLKGVHLTGPVGPGCATVAVLSPGENSTCDVQKAVIQDDFDYQEAVISPTSDLSLAVTATGSGNVTSPALSVSSPATTFTGLLLPVNRSLVVIATLSKYTVTLACAWGQCRAGGVGEWE